MRPTVNAGSGHEETGTAGDDPTALTHGRVDLCRDIVSDSGTRYHIRPIEPGDAARLVAFHQHLSSRSVYLRFFSYHPVLSKAEVTRFTNVDNLNRLALVATDGDSLLAVGRFDREAGDTEAEVAFVVADGHQHHGIGSLLLDELARAGRERGILTFRAETLFENKAMLDVFHHAGFAVESRVEFGTVILRFPISLTPAYEAALARREAARRGPHRGTSETANPG
jgi:GNAT superfamily N-acetyltransferase